MAELDRISRTGRRDHVTVTVIGGGPTGTELAGTLADLRAVTLPALFPEIDPNRVRISLIDRGPALLRPFRPVLRDYARRQLASRGVDVRLGTGIAEITADRVLLADGTAMPSDLTVWAAGVAAPDAVRGWGGPQAAGGAGQPVLALPHLAARRRPHPQRRHHNASPRQAHLQAGRRRCGPTHGRIRRALSHERPARAAARGNRAGYRHYRRPS